MGLPSKISFMGDKNTSVASIEILALFKSKKISMLSRFCLQLETSTSGRWNLSNITVVSIFFSSLLLGVPTRGLTSPTPSRLWHHQTDGRRAFKSCRPVSTSTAASSWMRSQWWSLVALHCSPMALRPTSTMPTLMLGHQDRPSSMAATIMLVPGWTSTGSTGMRKIYMSHLPL